MKFKLHFFFNSAWFLHLCTGYGGFQTTVAEVISRDRMACKT